MRKPHSSPADPRAEQRLREELGTAWKDLANMRRRIDVHLLTIRAQEAELEDLRRQLGQVQRDREIAQAALRTVAQLRELCALLGIGTQPIGAEP